MSRETEREPHRVLVDTRRWIWGKWETRKRWKCAANLVARGTWSGNRFCGDGRTEIIQFVGKQICRARRCFEVQGKNNLKCYRNFENLNMKFAVLLAIKAWQVSLEYIDWASFILGISNQLRAYRKTYFKIQFASQEDKKN